MAPQSKMFCPFKAVGIVAGDKPFFLRYLAFEKTFYLKVPVGNAFLIYCARDLSLRGISSLHRSAITCMARGSPHDFVGTKDGGIYCWSGRSTFQRILEGHKSEVHLMCAIGADLVSVDVENNLKVWHTEDGSLYLEMSYGKKTFDISVVCHPPTYLNKILLGSRQGTIKLLNLKTSKVIYEFSGWGSAVTVIEPAPVLDIAAIGLEDGRIVIHNLKLDETVMTLKQDWGTVTALSFRSDNNTRLLSGTAVGHVCLWDLEEQYLKSTIEKAHDGPIVSLTCAESDAMVYTSSTDNTIKSWIYDMPDGGGRLYIKREGHSEPPLRVRFHGASGITLLSAGQDSNIRVSSIHSAKNRSLGLACSNRSQVKQSGLKVARKMPPIINFTTEIVREEAWDNIAAIHLNTTKVTTWSFYKKKLNDQMLEHTRFKKHSHPNSMATCIEISSCGNFVFVGYNTGHIDMYNIQSGIYKRSYGNERDEKSAVRGIVSHHLNRWLVSGSQDGRLQWWNLQKGSKEGCLELEGGINMMALHRKSGLLAVALDDWAVVVADIDTQSIVREFFGHYNQITDMAFTKDSKYLVTSSMDSSIRTWDVIAGCCVDHFLVPSPATSIAMSPVGDYLVSTHVDELGIYVWSNMDFLGGLSLHPLKEDYKPVLLNLPASTSDLGHHVVESDDEDNDQEDMQIDEYKSPAQISEDFVTIDLMPTSRWLTLVNIDQIKKRNKPVEAPKAPKSAPFFLESVSGVEAKLTEVETESESKSKILDKSKFILETLSPFGMLLKKADHDAAFEKLVKMSPTNIDLEIRNLDPDVGGSREVMLQFMHMIKNLMKTRSHFEVVQGYLALFMKRHADFLSAPDTEVKSVLSELAAVQSESWRGLKTDLNTSLCLLSFFKNSAMLNY